MLIATACSSPSAGPGDSVPTPAATPPAAASRDEVVSPTDEPLELGPVHKRSQREHPSAKAWIFTDGKPGEALDLGVAEAKGYTVVDLSDDWVPYIFRDKTPGLDDASPNGYAKRYVELANDRTNSDGRKLAAHEHNFLELYGIPPTLSVIAGEWSRIVDDIQPCLDQAGYDPTVIAARTKPLEYSRGAGAKRLRRARHLRNKLGKAMRKARLAPDDLAAAAEHPKSRSAYARWRKVQDEVEFVEQVQIRFRCERLFDGNEGRGRSKPGDYDSPTHHALAAFEKKHNLRGWGHFAAHNMRVLAEDAVSTTHARLRRLISERAVAAASVIEDGSAGAWRKDFTYKDEAGTEHGLRDLATEVTTTTLAALGFEDVETARAQLDKLVGMMERGDEGLGTLLVAIRLPEPPAYYADDMQFDAVIDRGDVWYDFPYDEEGNKIGQRRRRKPRLTLYTTYLDQRIPLVRWPTTIGSWRSEEHEGREWFAYKNSDVGKRVWKDIVAAPVWVPPESTPVRTLVKRRVRRRKYYWAVNYDETGPSYKSAYGLVAAYHIRQVFNDDGTVRAELDNQIRTHGSVDYMSIMRRYSHGCHRLYNMSAVRLFSFILQHRDYVRHGQTPLGYRRAFEYEGESFNLALDTRGYRYELTTPIQVNVLKGRIQGRQKTPYRELMPKPGEDYSDGETGEGDTAGSETGDGEMWDFDNPQ
ncbi:MAG: hypothetical protein B7733_04755 [Myxococcales bacterium FL481]|nr:MAG: hypothetical protein B7733_04755 [Myxococcales bacterium FL481]